VTPHGTVPRVVDEDTVKVTTRGFEDTVRLVTDPTQEVRDRSHRARAAGRGLWGPPCRGRGAAP
jgi:hypothetical protein